MDYLIIVWMYSLRNSKLRKRNVACWYDEIVVLLPFETKTCLASEAGKQQPGVITVHL